MHYAVSPLKKRLHIPQNARKFTPFFNCTLGLVFLLMSGVLWANGSNSQQKVTVLFTNDVHGGIVPTKAEFLNPEFPPYLGGGGSAVTIINEVRSQAEKAGTAVLLLDAGDVYQGTLVGTKSKGQAVIEYMNMAGYDAVTVGNHEFDLGKEVFMAMVDASQFPWVACNIYDKETGDHWEYVKPSVIVEKAGLKIGIIGAATVGTQAMSFPENIRGLEFRNEIVEVQKEVDRIRDRVDLVMVLAHIGLSYDREEGYRELRERSKDEAIEKGRVSGMELAHYVNGIDVMLSGHIHRGYDQPWVDPKTHTICLQNYGNGGNLGWLDLEVDRATRTIAGYSTPADESTLLLLTQDQFWPDSTVDAFLKKQQEVYEAGFREVLGTTQTALTRSSIGEGTMNNFITDILRQRAQADAAFMNYGGLRADLRAGPLTREDVFKVLPFGNEIVAFQCSGKFLKMIIEAKLYGSARGMTTSGMEIVFNPNLPTGQRVVSLTVNGEPLDPEKTYRVATNDYLMEGNSGLMLLRRIPENMVVRTGIRLADAVAEYIQDNSPFSVAIDGRWKRDESAQPSAEWLEKFGQ